ncbi:MAG TPA: response regulator [Polyangiales bacterium]|nr:response regulator [Polyangiales bacterium]
MRVLLVEDDVDTADLLSLVLENEGCVVRVATNAISALRELKRFDPAVALIDIGLPVIDGYELAKRIRARSRCRLIAVSSWPRPLDGSYKAYFERYLMKPIDVGSLREALAAVREE